MKRMVAPGVWRDEGPASAHMAHRAGEPLPVTTLAQVKPRPSPWSVQQAVRARFEARRREATA